ncbi:MAG: hypothetical protein ACJ8MO_28615 [Bacillus sp. (in: firmicutes)]
MSGLNFDVSHLLNHLDLTDVRVRSAVKLGVQDSMDDLKRIAVDIAPIDSADLRRSGQANVTQVAGHTVGEVTFRAIDNGFDYATWIHEGEYNLGPLSAQAPGTDGYSVGNKYLERPLRGESDKYLRWIAEEIKDAVGD